MWATLLRAVVNISCPGNYPDIKAIAEFVGKTRDGLTWTLVASQPGEQQVQ